MAPAVMPSGPGVTGLSMDAGERAAQVSFSDKGHAVTNKGVGISSETKKIYERW